ncbi:H-NS histone family protein [Burkholderia cenocepacia]|uniref:H-NS histone family protein n=1 Tax=Burkholderia cenocepacia TaxID=95486 RepID=UPI0022372886|nr:H-NS histone family protein [Burkholderia cenocepacia]MCW5156328.1 H-NS histone family protein [Burkholderia cenocepacia]
MNGGILCIPAGIRINQHLHIMATYRELMAQKEKLEAQLEQMYSKERDGAIALILEKMVEFEISPDELAKASRKRKPRAKNT